MKTTIAAISILLAASLTAWGQPAAKSNKVDDAITDQVRLKLAGDPEVNGGALDVDTKGGVVTLSGKVRTDHARQKAEKDAKKVKGVKSVDNKITVDTNAH